MTGKYRQPPTEHGAGKTCGKECLQKNWAEQSTKINCREPRKLVLQLSFWIFALHLSNGVPLHCGPYTFVAWLEHTQFATFNS
jgi:hypothetical protein